MGKPVSKMTKMELLEHIEAQRKEIVTLRLSRNRAVAMWKRLIAFLHGEVNDAKA